MRRQQSRTGSEETEGREHQARQKVDRISVAARQNQEQKIEGNLLCKTTDKYKKKDMAAKH